MTCSSFQRRAMASMSAFFLAFFLLLCPDTAVGQVAVRGATIYTMDGAAIRDGIVLVRDGKIESVGPASRISIPDGYRIMTAEVVTPGLIDAHSVVGLAGIYNNPHDQDQLEKSDPIQPDLRAMDAYNPREELVTWLRELGVTTVHTGHGPGALISGQTMTVKTRGETLSQALVDSTTMVAFSLGPIVEENFKKPGTRAKSVAMLREALLEADAYRSRRQDDDTTNDGTRELGKEALGQVLNGDVPALITAHRTTEIMSALRLAEEFRLDLVLDGAAESYLLIDEIKSAGVPVILHPTMARPSGELENITFETAKLLHDAGIRVALQSGYEGYVPKTRVVLFEAAIAAANGMSFEDALATITIEPARILGIDMRVGSLTAGKDADIVLFDGDPFEYTSHVCGVIIEGDILSETCK